MKILVAGDFCPQNRVAELFEKGDFATVLGEMKPIIEEADYSIVNFECPVTYGYEKPIAKIGPNLQCTEKGIEAIKWVGFGGVTLANNHFYDFGDEGVDHTLKACEEFGIDTVGGGKNLQEASRILYKEIKGQILAIVNCCEHEFSIATNTSGGSNPLNSIQQYYSIKEARNNADFVLVIVHGGHEMYQLPSSRMQETYRFFVDVGADAVINHHQHCYSGYEVYKGKPIFYGLGNFCFDWRGRDDSWYCGYLASISFEKEVKLGLIPYSQCKEGANVLLDSEANDLFQRRIHEYNVIISHADLLKDANAKYLSSFSMSSLLLFQPYRSRLSRALFRRKYLPSLLSKRELLIIKNYLQCESHLEKLINAVLSIR